MTNIVSDEASTVAMIAAFDQAKSTSDQIFNAVQAGQSELNMHWGGGAAKTFDNSVNEWLDGFNQIRRGLADLDTAMNGYRQVTSSTEDQTQTSSGGWAGGH